MADTRIPTHLWVEAEIRRLSIEGTAVYVLARGDRTGGLVIQKISDRQGRCKLLIQQRDFSGVLNWINVLEKEIVSDAEGDAYIARAIGRDPDLWAVEIEDPTLKKSFLN
jgi:hypothetical protein